MTDPITVFILSYERPLYLWACLDSLYRNTDYPCRIILADNNSADPMVRHVLEGFERRNLFHTIYYCTENDPDRIPWLLENHQADLGEFFVIVESDVLIEPSDPCWLEQFRRLMVANPRLGMLGSLIDSSDFIALDLAVRVEPDADIDAIKAFIKERSPERSIEDASAQEIITPYNPPGRLLMIRSETLNHVPFGRDSVWHTNMIKHGYETGIATSVIHRHLSLLNFFDYDNYDMEERDEFFRKYNPDQKTMEWG